MNYWNEICYVNIIEKMKPLVTEGMYKIKDNGQFVCAGVSLWDGPWLHQLADRRWCTFYHHVLYDVFKLLPRQCKKCWKTVVRPKNVVDLFKLYELQKDMAISSKCGIETREIVHGLYGGYFYSFSKEEGIKLYKKVKKAIASSEFKEEPNMMLKRGCTEMESYFGRSDMWDELRGKNEMGIKEDIITDYFIWEKDRLTTPKYGIHNIHKKWIQWAYQHGDPTYTEFTDGQPLQTQPVTYHPPDDELDDVFDIVSLVKNNKKEDKDNEK